MNLRDRGAKDAAEQRAHMIGLGRAVERLRLEAGLTRNAVAKGGGLTGNTISAVERARKSEVKWGTVRRLAKGLNVNVWNLNQLAIQLAPCPGGNRLRQEQREARDVDVDALIAEAEEDGVKDADNRPLPAPIELPFPTLDTFGEAELLDLDDRSAHILRMMSGMVDGERHTLREIGEELGISLERVRQLQRQGLLVIRQVREVQRHLRDKASLRRSYRWRTPE